MADNVIELSDDDDDDVPVPGAAPAAADGVIELSDDDEPAASARPTKPAVPLGTGDADAPLTLEEDEDDAEAARQKRQRLAAAACKLCEAARLKKPYKLASCGHEFCRSCLVDFVSRKLRRLLASEVVCPTCAQQLTINDVQTLSAASAGSSTGGGGGPSGHGGFGGGGPSGLPPGVAMMLQRHGMNADALGLGGGWGGGGGSGGGGGGGGPDAALGSRPVGSSIATKRLMKELQQINKSDVRQHGFSVELPDGDNLYTWDAHFFDFEKGTALAKDLQKVPNQRIDLRIAFPSSYPNAPPYVRVLRPRFAYRTGHVTIGGSICTEMLTSTGWSSTMTVESVLLGIRANMLVGGARLEPRDKRDYSEAEAREAFNRMKRDHGWH